MSVLAPSHAPAFAVRGSSPHCSHGSHLALPGSDLLHSHSQQLLLITPYSRVCKSFEAGLRYSPRVPAVTKTHAVPPTESDAAPVLLFPHRGGGATPGKGN